MSARDYMKEYRDAHPEYRDRNNIRNKARSRALEILKRRHLAEFNTLYEQELKNAERTEVKDRGREDGS